MSKQQVGTEQVVNGISKPNSRVTKAHIEQLEAGMKFASDPANNVAQRLGYLSFAVASVLKDVGETKYYDAIARKMFDNFS